MDFTAIDEVFGKINQQQRPDSSLDLFKLIRKRDWDGGGGGGSRRHHKLAQSTLNKLAADRKMKYISTVRSNPYVDRTVIFNQFTSNVIQAASATLLNSNMEPIRDEPVPENIQQQQQQQRRLIDPFAKSNPAVRFNLNRNELNLLNEEAAKKASGLFRVSSASLANKFDIVIPTGMVLPSIKRTYGNGPNDMIDSNSRRYEHESVFDRLNPKYVISKKKRNSLTKVWHAYAYRASSLSISSLFG